MGPPPKPARVSKASAALWTLSLPAKVYEQTLALQRNLDEISRVLSDDRVMQAHQEGVRASASPR